MTHSGLHIDAIVLPEYATPRRGSPRKGRSLLRGKTAPGVVDGGDFRAIGVIAIVIYHFHHNHIRIHGNMHIYVSPPPR